MRCLARPLLSTLAGGSWAARRLAFGLVPRGFATTLLRFRMAEMLLVFFRRLLIGFASLAESDGDRLLTIFHLLSARPRTKFAVLELVDDPFDGFLLRLGLARRHLSSPFDVASTLLNLDPTKRFRAALNASDGG